MSFRSRTELSFWSPTACVALISICGAVSLLNESKTLVLYAYCMWYSKQSNPEGNILVVCKYLGKGKLQAE